MSKVVVIGGGVSGLTTALCLQKQFKDAISELTVLAAEFPGDYHAADYTSPWAGADWASFAKDSEPDQIRRDKLTYDVLIRLADSEPAAGIKKYPLKFFRSRSEPLPWYIKQRFVQGIRIYSADEIRASNLDPAEMQGFEFTSVTITPTRYNSYLISRLTAGGATIRRTKKLDSITDIVALLGYVPTLVVNCTGLSAGKLLRDVDPVEAAKVFPVKGQIVQIYEDLPFQVIIEDLPAEDNPLPNQFLNIFPRVEGGCIVGGIVGKYDGSRDVDPELSESILRIAKKHVPELKSTTVYNSYAALRPGREGGVRIGYSEYPLANRGGVLKVVHNYGIAGAGYQSSYGSAIEVCGYATRALNGRSKCPFKL
ncbi:(ZYRO0B01892g) [Zygosaccharomyces parabailii]|uniref:ZYBA0S05-05908g1_1 n=1 Tax=Zygosaccharomyces bailii (strain CLIB 213 / ATCC 58445 / CBS 680 / BCRC 21525 / NBRC 1098 / NCYC 1416 / NRRL Y-2227) TaxID=1333698 RepID=A0A8J2T868_ZYGB2|nr:(ZYRO0B01892g) [Zygosaccharomyces parabailii]CDF89970.1 ZYBA0S05-05908g1_1 [Zygosaccharomyces bailii CLIB 213]CDH17726.1 uncharacterized protein ZBAI_09514 [Zygosaccharomyces bailii ISA1307]